MKIDFTYEPDRRTFGDIVIGECFRHDFTNYMKVKPITCQRGNAVRLSNGEMVNFTDAETHVDPLDLKVVKK